MPKEIAVNSSRANESDPPGRKSGQGDPNDESTIKVIHEPAEIRFLYLRLVSEAQNSIFLILPSTNAYLRDERFGLTQALRMAATERRVKVQILTPGPYAGDMVRKFNEEIENEKNATPMEHKMIREASTKNTVTVLVVDRKSSLIVEEKDASQPNFDESVGLATFSTSSSTVKSNIRFFERMWEEETLLENERKSRREAELLQDILAHDLRNFNQIILSNADVMLQEGDKLSLEQRKTMLTEIVTAVERSAKLMDRAKRLGRIINEESKLRPINLVESLERAVEIAKKAYPGKGDIFLNTGSASSTLVQADELLDDVFLNILSNSIIHSKQGRGPQPVEIRVEEVDSRRPKVENNLTANYRKEISKGEFTSHARDGFLKVSFVDRGKGIPDEVKEKVFTRYMYSSSGSGLGLSIVHALVKDRYSGDLKVKNRVEGDYTEGTIVEVTLRKWALP